MISKLSIKINSAIDNVKQKRKDIDAYLDKLEVKAVTELRRKMEEHSKTVEEMIHICEASLSSLSTIISDIERAMTVGNKEEKFITINKASVQTDKCCNILFFLKTELRDMNVNFEPNVTFSDKFKSLETI